ncbi:MAG: hypothetical protein LBJ69_01500 [Holosporales bacterium]|nr:hypothetical protein [Holosporales bacterium]
MDRSHGAFDVDKFITDPWAGNPKTGRAILDCSFTVCGDSEPLNMLDTILNRPLSNKKNTRYVTSFQWIRDAQVVGGNSSRKYVRNMILLFINGYRTTRGFWLEPESWDNATVGERIVNWILSYQFFASGANDKFQMSVLSSLSEHFSHLQKCYAAEVDPYSKLIAIKALIYCYCSMKTNQHRKIMRALHEVREIIGACLDDGGMFITGSPIDHFHIFRSLLEIRFIAKGAVADVFGDEFVNVISKMAYIVRFFRLCDGSISRHSGDSGTERESQFVPDRHMVDTALSVVEIGNGVGNPVGFDKLETKKSTIIINTKPRMIRSYFNSLSEPGINIFDFEASFGSDRLLNRSDISVIYNGFRTRIGPDARSFTKRSVTEKGLLFEGETQFPNKFFNLAMRREIELALNGQRLDCIDFILVSVRMDACFRLVFESGVDIKSINKRSMLLSVGASEYMFTYSAEGVVCVTTEAKTAYPSIEIWIPVSGGVALEMKWSIECLQ